MKINWQTKTFEDCLEKIIYTIKIQRKDFLKSGNYPIVSQEKELINGYWNNKKDSFKVNIPIIIFGDHTKVLKYINFDFVLGADGVKILQPKKFLDSKYFYYFLQNIDLRSLGYARHYRLLKENDVSVPESMAEQHRIVKILDKVFGEIEKAKENTENNLQNSKDLFESYLRKIFTNSEWGKETLGDVCEMICRGTSPKYIETKGLIILNQRCIRNHKIDFNFSRFHDDKSKKVSNDKLIRIGDVLINSTGVGTLGRVAQVRTLSINATVDSHVTIVRPLKSKFYNDFFGYALIYVEKEISKSGEGASGQIELARTTLKNNFKISYPKTISEQKSIVKKLDKLSEKTKRLEEIYKQKLVDLEELKKSILAKAFIGEL